MKTLLQLSVIATVCFALALSIVKAVDFDTANRDIIAEMEANSALHDVNTQIIEKNFQGYLTVMTLEIENQALHERNQYLRSLLAQNEPEKNVEKFLDAVATCENSNPHKNRYGIMNPGGERNGLAVLSEEEARNKVLEILRSYNQAYPGINFIDAMHIWAPPQNNDTWKHARCIQQKAGAYFSLNTPIQEIL